ncbi:MAG: hypothetical protein RSE62_03355 [Citrobacter sp.]
MATSKKFLTSTRAEILTAFGYVTIPNVDGTDGHTIRIADDPDAFSVTGVCLAELEEEAYDHLLFEVDPALYALPTFPATV